MYMMFLNFYFLLYLKFIFLETFLLVSYLLTSTKYESTIKNCQKLKETAHMADSKQKIIIKNVVKPPWGIQILELLNTKYRLPAVV